uniref:Uncharacterized protein n=1 Tax=Myotis myotis TaxID=51298 RepID=A0A7J8AMD4_MYOMY|nr:hypothetical protein mMyoMyo1_008080 [Myotis myotis]
MSKCGSGFPALAAPAGPSGSSPAASLLVPGAAMGSCPGLRSLQSTEQLVEARGLSRLWCPHVPLPTIGSNEFLSPPRPGLHEKGEEPPGLKLAQWTGLEIPHFLPWPVEETASRQRAASRQGLFSWG